MVTRDKKSCKLANFLHDCAGSTTIRTFQQAIKNIFLHHGQVLIKFYKRLITDQTNIAAGHMDQAHKNV